MSAPVIVALLGGIALGYLNYWLGKSAGRNRTEAGRSLVECSMCGSSDPAVRYMVRHLTAKAVLCYRDSFHGREVAP